MNRRAFAFDRVLAILLALALVAAAAWAVAWVLDALPAGWWAPDRIVLGLAPDVPEEAWWAWALIIGGLLVTAIGGAWLVAHFRSSRVERLSMPGDAEGGRLLLDGGALADGAAAALAESSPDVLEAGGRLVEHRRTLILTLTASVRPDVDLAEVVRACDEVALQVARCTGRYDVTSRVRLRVAAKAKRAPRVH